MADSRQGPKLASISSDSPMNCSILIAAGDPVETVIGLLFIVFAVLAALIAAAVKGPARYDVLTKRGVPYCPRCNRQVSYRRDYCRSCNYQFVSYGPTSEEVALERWQRQQVEERERLAFDERQRIRDEDRRRRAEERVKRRAEERATRLAEREAYYRGRGVEPGHFAWFKVLPDWQQAVLAGLAVAVPLITILIALLRGGR